MRVASGVYLQLGQRRPHVIEPHAHRHRRRSSSRSGHSSNSSAWLRVVPRRPRRTAADSIAAAWPRTAIRTVSSRAIPIPAPTAPSTTARFPRLGAGFDLRGQALDDLAESQVAGQESELPPAEAGRAARRLAELARGQRDVDPVEPAHVAARRRREWASATAAPSRVAIEPASVLWTSSWRSSSRALRACFQPAPRLRTSARSVRSAECRPRPATPAGRPCASLMGGSNGRRLIAGECHGGDRDLRPRQLERPGGPKHQLGGGRNRAPGSQPRRSPRAGAGCRPSAQHGPPVPVSAREAARSRGAPRGPARAARSTTMIVAPSSWSTARSCRNDPRGRSSATLLPSSVTHLRRRRRASSDATGRGSRRRPTKPASSASPTISRISRVTFVSWAEALPIRAIASRRPRGVECPAGGDSGAREDARENPRRRGQRAGPDEASRHAVRPPAETSLASASQSAPGTTAKTDAR